MDEGVLGGSPAATKVCWSICSGDSVRSSSGGTWKDGPINGDRLVGRDEIWRSLPKTFLGVVSTSVSLTFRGLLSFSRSSLRSNRKSLLPFLVYWTSWYVPFWLCIRRCRPSNLSTPSGCVMSTLISGKAECFPAGRIKRKGFSGKSSLMPKLSTSQRSVVERSWV